VKRGTSGSFSGQVMYKGLNIAEVEIRNKVVDLHLFHTMKDLPNLLVPAPPGLKRTKAQCELFQWATEEEIAERDKLRADQAAAAAPNKE
jgi:hypothetical protein